MQSRFRPIVKSEQGPSPALLNIAAMKDSGRIRRMTDYGTAASANLTPSRDMVEQSSRLATELELSRAMDLKSGGAVCCIAA
jgi:hypothetical protein